MSIIDDRQFEENRDIFIRRNLQKIINLHSWDKICSAYLKVFLNLLNK